MKKVGKNKTLKGEQKMRLADWIRDNKEACASLDAPSLTDKAIADLGFEISACSVVSQRKLRYPDLVFKYQRSGMKKANGGVLMGEIKRLKERIEILETGDMSWMADMQSHIQFILEQIKPFRVS